MREYAALFMVGSPYVKGMMYVLLFLVNTNPHKRPNIAFVCTLLLI